MEQVRMEKEKKPEDNKANAKVQNLHSLVGVVAVEALEENNA
jgi:hypothetical protein